MQAEFANSIDPVFLAMLNLESRIERGERIVTADERAVLVRKIEEAEARLGRAKEWELAKYAICAWIDSRLIELPWESNNWWKEHCLEAKFFRGSRTAHEDFFRKAREASEISTKNALEVFFIAVVLGFRGIYADKNISRIREFTGEMHIPETVEGWCREAGRSIHLRPGVPENSGIILFQQSNRPLQGKKLFTLYAMLSALAVAFAISCFIILFTDLFSG